MASRIGKYKVTKRDSAISLIDGGKATGKISLAGGHLKTVKLSGGGTTVLTAADSGATCVFDTAGASQFTLPAPELGMYFTFISAITATADHVIKAATNDHGFLGGMIYTQLTSTAADQCDSFSAATSLP